MPIDNANITGISSSNQNNHIDWADSYDQVMLCCIDSTDKLAATLHAAEVSRQTGRPLAYQTIHLSNISGMCFPFETANIHPDDYKQ